MNKKLDKREPGQEYGIYPLIAIVLVIITGGISYLYPNILPKGSFSVALGISFLFFETFNLLKAIKMNLFNLVFGTHFFLDGINHLFNLESNLPSIVLMVGGIILIFNFLNKARKGKYDL